MNKKLYVGNLPFDVAESSLREMFEADGRHVSSIQIITDRDTGRSRGFGFVEFESAEDAKNAIAALNGKELNGRALTVNEAREQTRDGGGGRGGSFGGGGSGGGFRGDRGGKRSSRW